MILTPRPVRVIVAIAFFVVAACTQPSANHPGQVNVVGCSLFNEQGKLLKKYLGWACAFFPNGKMLIGDGFTLTFYDEKMNVVWSRDTHIHHMFTYSPESGLVTVIGSNIIRGDTRIDRLEVYDIEGKLLKSYSFQPSQSVYVHKQDWDFPVFPYVKKGLTMIESFYPIGKNQSKLPYLAEGNFLAYDSSGLLYFFSPDLQLVHQIYLRKWGFSQLRDVQVTKAGNLFFYNSGNMQGGAEFTSIDELDPVTHKLVWSYRADPPHSLFGKYEGNAQMLPNGNVLFSVVMDELKGKDRKVIRPEEFEVWMHVQGHLRAYEVTPGGKRVWEMSNDGTDLSGMPNVIKRVDLSAYLQAKGRY